MLDQTNCVIWSIINHAFQKQFLVCPLKLREVTFDSIELRTVRHIERIYPSSDQECLNLIKGITLCRLISILIFLMIKIHDNLSLRDRNYPMAADLPRTISRKRECIDPIFFTPSGSPF
jgi:hypothetical protein